MRQTGPALAGAALLALMPAAALAQEGSALRLEAGRVTLRPTGLLQLDWGTSFDKSRAGAPATGVNPRRARIGVEAEAGDFEATFIWDFGGSPGDRGRLYQASLRWNGPLRVTAGVFETSFSLHQQRESSDLLFLERAAVTELAEDLGAGSGRTGLEVAAIGERWHAAAAVTGGRTGPGEDSSQRNAVARVAGLPIRTDEVAVHLGVSGIWSFRPPRGEDGERGADLSQSPELAVDRRSPPLDAGFVAADEARVGGVEIGVGWRRLQAQAEYYRIELDRAASAGGGTRHAEGWYAQASYTLLGRPREWEAKNASWSAPRPDGAFDPRNGAWGAVEIGARISELDLNDRDLRGGRQRIYAAALGWWPSERVGVLAQYQWVEVVGGEAGDLRYQAVGVRTQLRF